MKLYNTQSKEGFINLFADEILKQFGLDTHTIINVINVDNFIIIKGITDSKKIIDIHEFKLKYHEENKDYLNSIGIQSLNTIELIEYKESIQPKDYLWFKYYKSDRPVFSQKQITYSGEYISIDQSNFLEVLGNNTTDVEPQNYLYTSSEFPYGYSLPMGRLLMYYGEMIYYNTKSSFPSDNVAFKITTKKHSDDFAIEFSGSTSPTKTNEKMKSSILDLFDFDLENFRKVLDGYDVQDDIKKQVGPKPWLTKVLDPQDVIFF